MCWDCDHPGEDSIGHMIDVVEEHGWGISGVESGPPERQWSYTVGLPYRFGHPELLLRGGSPDHPAMLNHIAEYIRDSGRRIEAGEVMHLGHMVVGFGVVSRKRRRSGEIAMSMRVHRRLGINSVTALEVFHLPQHGLCDQHFELALHDWIDGAR